MATHGRRRQLEPTRQLARGVGPLPQEIHRAAALRVCERAQRAIDVFTGTTQATPYRCLQSEPLMVTPPACSICSTVSVWTFSENVQWCPSGSAQR
jgi:hypothetical protein